jgi:hypothetical protein
MKNVNTSPQPAPIESGALRSLGWKVAKGLVVSDHSGGKTK